MGTLFDPTELAHFATEMRFSNLECEKKLRLLQSIATRHASGGLSPLIETRVEQSFNERLFADVFDYNTLFRNGAAEYHLEPKGYFEDRVNGRRVGRYNDFSLGFFGQSQNRHLVSGELKSPGANLDLPQTATAYGGLSAVQQAHNTAPNSSTIEWIIVSNIHTIRLYRRGNTSDFEEVNLLDILSYHDVRRALCLFSRKCLIGDGEGPSPITQLITGAIPRMIPSKSGHVRLVQQAHLDPAFFEDADLPLFKRDSSLQFANQHNPEWPPNRRAIPWKTTVEGDRLVSNVETPQELFSRTEFTSSGILRVTEYIKTSTGLSGDELLYRLAGFVSSASFVFDVFASQPIYMNWELLDLDQTTTPLIPPTHWAPVLLSFRVPSTVSSTKTPIVRHDYRSDGLKTIQHAISDLLYLFESVSLAGAPTMRLLPDADNIRSTLSSINFSALPRVPPHR